MRLLLIFVLTAFAFIPGAQARSPAGGFSGFILYTIIPLSFVRFAANKSTCYNANVTRTFF
jgi:hypothetical protein